MENNDYVYFGIKVLFNLLAILLYEYLYKKQYDKHSEFDVVFIRHFGQISWLKR